MWRKGSLVALLALAGFGTAVAVARPAGPDEAAHAQRAQAFVIKAKVARIVDGDTLVALYKNRNDRVRLIGINTPEIGQCNASEATAAARSLAAGRKVRLIGDPTQAKRDRFGRLLAYVVLPNGHDLGRDLIRLGGGVVYIYDKPFARLNTYRAAESAAKGAGSGLWTACKVATTTSTSTDTSTTSTTVTGIGATATTTSTTSTSTTTTTGGNCTPSYPGVCIPPPPPDLDCGQIPYRNFGVIYTVPNPDPHRFDGDHDGIGCES